MGGVDEDSGPGTGPDGTDVDRRQRPMEVDRSKYYETGQLNVAEGPLGTLPTVMGEAPVGPEPGLRADNFVCNGIPDPTPPRLRDGEVISTEKLRLMQWARPPCEHYAAVLLPADGVAKGFGEMKQIRRFCLKMATASELFELDGDVFACTLRSPQDNTSVAKINDFEARQRQLAAEAAETSGELDF